MALCRAYFAFLRKLTSIAVEDRGGYRHSGGSLAGQVWGGAGSRDYSGGGGGGELEIIIAREIF